MVFCQSLYNTDGVVGAQERKLTRAREAEMTRGGLRRMSRKPDPSMFQQVTTSLVVLV